MHVIKLTAKQRRELRAIVGRRSNPGGLARRAQVVLQSAAGKSGGAIAEDLDLSVVSVSRIRRRFAAGGVPGLADRPKAGRQDHEVSAATEKQTLELSMSPPPAGRSRWTTLLLGVDAGLHAERGSAPRPARRAGFTQFRRATETPFNLVFEVRAEVTPPPAAGT